VGAQRQNHIAHALQIPLEDVQVVYALSAAHSAGKRYLRPDCACLAALHLHRSGHPRPVKIVWNARKPSSRILSAIRLIIRAKWVRKKTGKITAAQIEIIADGGAYASSSAAVVGSAATLEPGRTSSPM
jgi:CO/xanthine dehydrogenase Mo-binding subunit